MLAKATGKDKERITAFYRHVAENTKDIREYCRWVYGLHPSPRAIEKYIDDGNMYYKEENGTIVAAVAVTFFQGEEYRNTNWARKAQDNEVSVLHLLAVDPERSGRGIGRKTVEDVIEISGKRGMKAVRLDALASNTPALNLYASLGFAVRGRENWFAENTGDTDFLLLEKVL